MRRRRAHTRMGGLLQVLGTPTLFVCTSLCHLSPFVVLMTVTLWVVVLTMHFPKQFTDTNLYSHPGEVGIISSFFIGRKSGALTEYLANRTQINFSSVPS